MADISYQNSQKRMLIDLVVRLCAKLCRPVCSADIDRHLSLHPQERPFLLKCMGQQLITASQPLKTRSGCRLYKSGRFRAKNYYAPDNDPGWARALEQHIASVQLAELQRLRVPQALAALDGTCHLAAAKEALERWHSEVAQLSAAISHPMLLRPSAELGAFITRVDAAAVLESEMASRRESIYGFSVARHLSRLRWPQSSLFAASPSGYLPRQIRYYIRSRWPLHGESPDIDRGLFFVMRYGLDPNASNTPPVSRQRDACNPTHP